MVSSRFCLRSAMFLTVRKRLVSGSSPGKSKALKRGGRSAERRVQPAAAYRRAPPPTAGCFW